MSKLPKNFQMIQERFGPVVEALDALREQVRKAGPLDEKTAHLAQIAACAANQSEGGVHSHARRALKAGASADEIRHVLVTLIPTIGFPRVAAALSWAEDVLESD